MSNLNRTSPVASGVLLDENRRLREALQSILESMEQMPQLNEAIVEEIMRGDHTLECEIGGDEANISSWVAIARMALSSNAKVSSGDNP
jgi:hypothetical protein